MFERIKELRKYEDFTMMQIADKLNVKRSTYSTWECGRDVIPLKRLIKLANVYQVKIDYLMNLTNDNQKINKIYSSINLKVVAKNLLNLRKNNNLTQEQIADSIHISRSSWENYECGRILITTIPLYELCQKYNISSETILF